LIITTTLKSHFKIKKLLKKSDSKSVFVKNIIIFILFSSIFLKSFKIKLNFFKKRFNYTNILKAPSRHKKFFHQVGYECFLVKVIFYSNAELLLALDIKNSVTFFGGVDTLFQNFGSNTLNRINFTLRYSNCCFSIFRV
jgi:hypothetical protein